ncbi:MAG: ribonuclease P protein component [Cyclobacteriaceae bacterium]
MGKFSFHKGERLKKEKLIQELFTKGSSFNLYPFRIVYLPNPQEEPFHQALFSASVKAYKRAVDRNKIKRRSREAYRLQKSQLNETPRLLIGFIYTAKEILTYEKIALAVKKAIEKLNRAHI